MAKSRRVPAALLRSLRVQGFTLSVVLILLPALLYSIFWKIENERRNLLVSAVRDAGTAIAAGLAPELQALQPVDFDSLDSRLARFADPHRRITLLFHPAGSAATEQFFFVAGVPPVSVEQLGRARVGDVIPVTATSGPVLSAIERDGFFLVSGIHAQFKRWKARRRQSRGKRMR
jgi:hypothetical protein